ncbi:MAG: tetratricopeptide repeat protein [Pirellulales bacterium]
MKKRLYTDRRLSPLLAQFVPLDLKTNSPDWQAWARRYKCEGLGIPMVYVVRADGTQLYGRSGSLPDEALPLLLIEQIRQSGKAATPKQLALWSKAAEAARQYVDQGQIAKAVVRIVPFLGTGCYAAPAVALEKMAGQLGDEGRAKLARAEEKLAATESAFEGAAVLMEVNRQYAKLPPLKKPLTQTLAKYRKDPKTRELLKHAELFDRAKFYEENEQPKQAAAAYQLVISRYPDTAAAEMARAKLKELDEKPTADDKTRKK